MNIIAMDLGTKTGWADSFGQYGELNMTPAKWESAGMVFHKFRTSMPMVRTYDLVVYEAVTFQGKGGESRVLQGLTAILQEFCIEHEIEYTGVPVSTLKKFFTGKGNAKKADMRAALAEGNGWRGPYKDVSHNVVDAIALLQWAQVTYTL
jgi:hypothetical protein